MPAGEPDWNTSGLDHESSNDVAPSYELVDVSDAIPLLQDGDNVLAVGNWNVGPGSSDLVLVPLLVANRVVAVSRGPYLQKGTPDSIVVRWRTNAPTDARVLYGTVLGNLTLSESDSTIGTEHEVELTGLSAYRKYYYAVGTSDEILSGDDEDHFFRTPPLAGTARRTRAWILGDSGTGNSNAIAVRNAYYAVAGTTHTDLWIMLGDNAMPSGTDYEYQIRLFDIYPEMLRKSVLWPTLGNHDGMTAQSSTQSGGYYDVFTLPTAGEAGGVPSGTEAYYSFDHSNIHFVVLDSHETDRSPDGMMANWLKLDLADTTQDWIIAYWHHPPYSKGGHDSDTDLRMIDMRTNFVPILDDYGVDLAFAGHSHNYERSFLIEGVYETPTPDFATLLAEGRILDAGSGVYVQDGPYHKPVLGPDPHSGIVHTVAGSSGTISGGSLDHPVMFSSANVLGSVILTVNDDRLDAHFLSYTGAVLDHWTMIKGPLEPVADFVAAPTAGQNPLTVDFTDTSENEPTSWSWDFENDGTPDSFVQHPVHQYEELGLYSVELSVSNPAGSDVIVRQDEICVHAGPPGAIGGLRFQDDVTFFWDAYPAVTSFDAVKGDLLALRAGGGDFSVSELECVEEDGGDTQSADGTPLGTGQAFFYLVRGTDCAGQTGSFDTTGPGQVASRDPGSQGACNPG
jgi:PKD repeat protein